MKFNVLQQDFLPALQTAFRSVGAKSALPVLDNILLATDGNNLRLAATNLEIGMIKLIPVEVIDPGEITVPAKTLVEIVSGLKQVKIEIEADLNNLTIKAGKFKATINGIPSTEFPVIPLSQSEGTSFKKEVLQSSAQILFASAVDEGRPILTGILTQVDGEKLDFVATDGFRLAHRQIKLEGKGSDFKSLIPRKTFEEVLRILSEEDVANVSISTSENQNQAIFDFGNTKVSSRLIEGNFPSWEKIIPTNIIVKVVVEKDEIVKAIKLASIFAKNEANVVIVKTSPNKISIESSAKELGSQQNEIEANVEGADMQIAFNARFLLDAIMNCPTKEVLLNFSGELSATLVNPVGFEGLQFIVMPIRMS